MIFIFCHLVSRLACTTACRNNNIIVKATKKQKKMSTTIITRIRIGIISCFTWVPESCSAYWYLPPWRF